MQRTLTRVLAMAAAVGLAACSDTTSPVSADLLLSDAQLTNDVAVSAADVAVDDINAMIGNEVFAGLAAAGPLASPGVTITRSRTCYDQNDQPQAQCDAQTTASILFTVSMDGNFGRTAIGPRGTDSLTVAVHRARSTTVSGLLGTETFRIHDGVGASHDTTHLVGIHQNVTLDRLVAEASVDSAQSVRFDLPRASNPFPVSGKLVRRVTGTVTLTVNDSTATRTFDRMVVVTFPADAQANVPMTITAGGTTKSCQLNLVTRRVTGCL